MTPKLSLIINTYERPDALAAVLRSVERQSVPPHEVIIGDDGSGPSTKAVIDAAIARGMDIKHEWRAKEGFRLALMRNCALSRVTGDYVVIIDDDLLLRPEFVADHIATATPGYFVQGKRILLDESATRVALAADSYWPSFFGKGVERRRHLIHSLFLSKLFRRVNHLKGIRGCNFAAWYADVVAVNGFNEEFVGWGREDNDFAERLWNTGIRRINLRFAGMGCHLYHPQRDRSKLNVNDEILAKTLEEKPKRCAKGLDRHLKPSPCPS